MQTFDLTKPQEIEKESDEFVYGLGQAVQLVLSHEVGNVDDFRHGQYQDEYLIVYVNKLGCQMAAWWAESWIEPMTGDTH